MVESLPEDRIDEIKPKPEHLVSASLKHPPEFHTQLFVSQAQWETFTRAYGEEWVVRNCMLNKPIPTPVTDNV